MLKMSGLYDWLTLVAPTFSPHLVRNLTVVDSMMAIISHFVVVKAKFDAYPNRAK